MSLKESGVRLITADIMKNKSSQFHRVHKDAFSSGQIGSKLWLCEELEKLFNSIDTVWIYGGWYGVTGFLLLTRNHIKIKNIKSFDLDKDCESVADMINENWVIDNWRFKAFTNNCNNLTFESDTPDLIINTSTEHFNNMNWFNNIPKGIMVALQGNNMPHDDHVIHSANLKQFVDCYPLSKILYRGSKDFVYPEWKFTRYMIIGQK